MQNIAYDGAKKFPILLALKIRKTTELDARNRDEWTFAFHLHSQEPVLSVLPDLINGKRPKSSLSLTF